MGKKVAVVIFWVSLFLGFRISSAAIVSGLEVRGNRSVDSSLIINMSGLAVGSEIRSNTVQDAIKRIYVMNLFSDIQIYGTETESGINLTISVKEYPRVRDVDISGNAKMKTAEIKEKLNITIGKVITPVDTKSAVDKIKSLYNEKGYLTAQIYSELIQTDYPGQVILKLEIDEGKKVKIKKIYVLGNKAVKASKVKKQMENKEDRWWRGGEFKPDKYDEDKEKIIDFYKKDGFLDALIISDSLWYDSTKKNLFIQIVLNEGERYRFGQVSWEGNKLFTTEKLNQMVKFKNKEIYSQKKYEETMARPDKIAPATK